MEENKNTEVVEEKPVNNSPSNDEQLNKTSLVAFILGIVGATVWSCWIIGAIASIILGVIAIKKANASADVQKNPYKVFNKIAKILGIVSIIVGAIFVVVWLLYSILVLWAAALGIAASAA